MNKDTGPDYSKLVDGSKFGPGWEGQKVEYEAPKKVSLDDVVGGMAGAIVSAVKIPEIRKVIELLQKVDTTLIAGEVGKILGDLPLLISILRLVPSIVDTIFNTLKVVIDVLSGISEKTINGIIPLVIKGIDFNAINGVLEGVPDLEVKLLKPILTGAIKSLDIENVGKILNSTVKLVIDTIREDPTILSRLISSIDIGAIISDLFQILPQLIPSITSLLPQLISSMSESLKSSLNL